MFKKLLICIFFLTYIGCGTTIGNKADVSNVEFVLGQTTKNEVVETLGLPAGMINKLKEEGKEYWYYYKGPVLSGLVLPVPDIVSGVSADEFSIIDNPELKDAAVIFTFNKTGTLIDAVRKEN